MNKMQSAKRYGAAIGSIALYLLISVLYKGEYIYTVLQQICCFFVAVMGINFITGMTGQPMMGAAGVLAHRRLYNWYFVFIWVESLLGVDTGDFD